VKDGGELMRGRSKSVVVKGLKPLAEGSKPVKTFDLSPIFILVTEYIHDCYSGAGKLKS